MIHSAEPGRTLGSRIVRAGVAVGVAHLLFKLAGLIQAKAMAHFVDPGMYDAVYAVGFTASIFAIFLIGEEIIGPAFLPVFMRELDTQSEDAAWHFANAVMTLQCVILLVCIGVLMAFPGAIVRALTAWSPTTQPEQFAVATRSVRAAAPALLCLSLGSTTYMLLNGYKRFFLAALGDASWKFCVFAFVLVGMGYMGVDETAIVAGLVAGSAAKLATHLVGLRHELRRFHPVLALRHPAVRTMALLMLPLIAGILVAKARDIFNDVSVLSHIDAKGMMQANAFGRKLHQLIGWLIPYALSIAMFPFFCELVDRGDREKLGAILTKSAKMLLAVFIPLALVCFVMAKPITAFVFYGGKFNMQSVRWTSASMAFYTLALPATGIEYLLMQAFFANRKMVSVTVVGIVFSFLSMAISYAAVVWAGLTGTAALAAIAGGFALSRTLKSTALVILCRRFTPSFPIAETVSFLVRVSLVGCLAAGFTLLARAAYATWGSATFSRTGVLVEMAAGGALATLGFLLGIVLLRVREPFEMVTWATKRKARKT